MRWIYISPHLDDAGVMAAYYADFATGAQAAGASLVYLTAWHSLITRGNLRPAETVLIVGASGGVNTASIEIALTGTRGKRR